MLGELALAAERLPQLVQQLDARVQQWSGVGVLRVDDGPYTRRPHPSATAAVQTHLVGNCSLSADQLADVLRSATEALAAAAHSGGEPERSRRLATVHALPTPKSERADRAGRLPRHHRRRRRSRQRPSASTTGPPAPQRTLTTRPSPSRWQPRSASSPARCPAPSAPSWRPSACSRRATTPHPRTCSSRATGTSVAAPTGRERVSSRR